MSTPTLKPCAWCGSAPTNVLRHLPGDNTMRELRCLSGRCAAAPSVLGRTIEDAAIRWNARIEPEPSVRISTMDMLVEKMRPCRDRETISTAFRAAKALEGELLKVEPAA